MIDASVVVDFLTFGDAYESSEELVLEAGELFAPHLIDAEVGHALRRLSAAGEVAEADAETTIEALERMRLSRAPHTDLLRTAWSLRATISFYDALYLALGKELDLPVHTLDKRLARAGLDAGLDVRVLV